MALADIRTIATLAMVLGAASPAADGPAFEVVSIREVPRDAPPLLRDPSFDPFLPGGQFIDPRTTVLFMIMFAFDIHTDVYLTGLPEWARYQAFSVAAKPPDGFPRLPSDENREQMCAMLREMLASRFQLKLHTETREERTLKLEVPHGGLKIKAVDPPAPPEKEGFVNMAAGDGGGRMIARKATMASMATALTVILRRPVLDATGLKDYYTFDVKWSGPGEGGLGVEGLSALMSALEDLFGLRLTSVTAPVKYWVVDHVEHPTPN